jgi:predicted lipoprotein
MGRLHYQVVQHEHGWAYRLERTYSRIFTTQLAAITAARTAAIQMHEDGDETFVRVQEGPLNWRTELVIRGTLVTVS